jgi:aryl sulfotransferase
MRRNPAGATASGAHTSSRQLPADLADVVWRFAAFLDIAIEARALPAILEHCSLDYMRNAASKSGYIDRAFRQGTMTLFHKGANGRWKDIMSREDIARCDAVAASPLPPDCAHWLKSGELPV